MKTYSSSVIRELARKQGLEVVLFIGVKWNGGKETFYSSIELPGTKKNIIEMSDVETSSKIEGSGGTQSVSVMLSDTDGKISKVLNTVDIHKAEANVYLGFPGHPREQSVKLLDGEINSPVEWDERARTLAFTILSKIEGRRFGFAAEDGLFEDVDDSNRSQPWPFRFGYTCAYPAIAMNNGRTGVLRIGQGVLDATIDAKICQAKKIECPKIPAPLGEKNEPNGGSQNAQTARRTWLGDLDGDTAFTYSENTPFGTQMVRPPNAFDPGDVQLGKSTSDTGAKQLIRDEECERAKFRDLCQLLRDRSNQLVYVNDTLIIRGGEDFPQTKTIDIRIDDVIYTGHFVGDAFYIDKTNRLDKPTANVDCANVPPPAKGYRVTYADTPGSLNQCETPTSQFQLQVVGGAGEAWDRLDKMSDSKFKWFPAGSKVYLETTGNLVHVVSMVPGTIQGVAAYRDFGDTKQLTELPTDYYEVVATDYGGLEAIEIWLTKPLSAYADERWDDKLYVQFESDIGPNPVEVIEWIVERFTDFTVDADNFAVMTTKLANYPCNYYHGIKEDVLTTITRIAYEARCALTVNDGVVRLTYLSEEGTAVKTLTDSDIVAGTFSVRLTDTESLITSQEIKWEQWGAPVVEFDENVNTFTVENNTDRYGVFPSSRTYKTITDREQALKTATFWSIRESNTWKRIIFETTLEHMDLELYDTVQFNTRLFPNVKVVIETLQVDPDSGTVRFECWTPILSGSDTAYTWAWPASQNAGRPYPSSNTDVVLPLLQIAPPEGHPLFIDYAVQPVPPSTGDRYPSDLDDEFPEPVCQDMNDPVLLDAFEPEFREIKWPDDPGRQSTYAKQVTAANPQNNLGGGGGADDDKESLVCGRPSSEACVYEVWVLWGTCTQAAKANGGTLDSGCDLVPGPCKSYHRGQRCGGIEYTRCKTFGSDLMATAYKETILQVINVGYCSWRAGNVGPVGVTGPIKRNGSSSFTPCEAMGDVEVGNGKPPTS